MCRNTVKSTGRVLARWRGELGLALLVLGVRLWVFSYAGSPLPYYDQWIAEFNNIFLALRNGGSMWSVLLTPHNEHIIATTRLLSLAGFYLNGYWDVPFLNVAAAFVRAAEAVVLFRVLTHGVARASRIATWLLVAAVFVAPVSGFNLLCGLQVSFYFAELALLGALICMRDWSSGPRSGLMLILVTLIGGLSMGSALAIPPAALVFHLADGRKRPGFWFAWGATVAAGLAYAVSKAGTRAMHTALTTQIWFFFKLLSWPFASPWLGLLLATAVALTIVRLRRRQRLHLGALPAILGVGAFAAVNALMIALNRPASDFHLRHWETIALLPMTLGLFVTAVVEISSPPSWGLKCAIAGAAAACALAFGGQLARQSWPYIAGAHEHRAEALAHYQQLFRSGRFVDAAYKLNARVLREKDAFFDDPVLRFTPHPVVLLNIARAPLPALALLGPDILPSRPPSAVSIVTRALIKAGPVFAGIGAVLLLLGLRRRSPQNPIGPQRIAVSSARSARGRSAATGGQPTQAAVAGAAHPRARPTGWFGGDHSGDRHSAALVDWSRDRFKQGA